MAVRVKRLTNTAQVETNPMTFDSTQTQRETTVDGYTFHWGINEVRNFLDDGVGLAHAAFSVADTVDVDARPFGKSQS